MENEIKEMLDDYQGVNAEEELKKNKLIIFGAGSSGLRIKKYLESKGYEVSFFCDNDIDKQGLTFDGVKTLNPKELYSLNKKQFLVCIASEWRYDIALQLKAIGIKYLDLFYWDSRWKDHFKPSIIKENIDSINNAFLLLEDTQSKKVFVSILKYRLTLDPCQLIIANHRQYDHPLIIFKHGNAIIDGGAFDGRTSVFFREKFKAEHNIYAFEPQKNNFNSLVRNIERIEAENIVAVPFGLWINKMKKFININTATNQGYFVDNEGESEIDCVSLDSFCLKNNIIPGIIKLDIEGSELQALQGAINTIKSQKPHLIICVYHKPTDLWQIPLYLKSFNYKHYIAHHNSSLTESVLYCIA